MGTVSPYFSEVMSILKRKGYSTFSADMPRNLRKGLGTETVVVDDSDVRFVPAKGAISRISHAAFVAKFAKPFGTESNPFSREARGLKL